MTSSRRKSYLPPEPGKLDREQVEPISREVAWDGDENSKEFLCV